MIYTSYFAVLKRIPEDIVPVSIAAKTPDWFKGGLLKKLAPSFDILMEYKRAGDQNRYIERYNSEVLDKLSVYDVVNELRELRSHPAEDIVLLCYERPEKFCHRHLVSEWLKQNRYWKCWILRNQYGNNLF